MEGKDEPLRQREGDDVRSSRGARLYSYGGRCMGEEREMQGRLRGNCKGSWKSDLAGNGGDRGESMVQIGQRMGGEGEGIGRDLGCTKMNKLKLYRDYGSNIKR